jgi:hypothetical protein
LKPEETYACDTHDLAALDALRELRPMRMLAREEFLPLLRALAGHPRVTFGKSARVEIAPDIFRPRLRLTREPGGSVTLRSSEQLLAAGGEMWTLRGERFQPLPEGLPAELGRLADEPLTFRGARALAFLAFEASRLREWFEVETDGDILLPEVRTEPPQIVLRLEGSLSELRAELRARYPDGMWEGPLRPDNPEILGTREGTIFLRDTAAENKALGRLEQLGFSPRGDRFVLTNENAVARFFAFERTRLPGEWEVRISAQAERSAASLEPLAPKIEVVGSGEDWFELRYSLATPAGENFPAAELQRLLRSGQSQTRLRNGRTAVFDAAAITDFEEVLRDVDPTQVQPGIGITIDQPVAGLAEAHFT